jgi:hypothetical protein
MSFVLVTITDPTAAFAITSGDAFPTVIAPVEKTTTQTVIVAEGPDSTVEREAYSVTKVVVPPPPTIAAGAPAAGTPNPGSAQAIAHDMVVARGWDESQYSCLVALWNRESGWNAYAFNKGSGAYGIPQALPGSKMASAGADWATNPATQITWGLGYIQGRYQNPCGAWSSSQSRGWY